MYGAASPETPASCRQDWQHQRGRFWNAEIHTGNRAAAGSLTEVGTPYIVVAGFTPKPKVIVAGLAFSSSIVEDDALVLVNRMPLLETAIWLWIGMINPPMPKAILFDLGDTVLREIRFEPHAGISRLLELSTTVPNACAEEIQKAGDELHQEFRTGRGLGVELPCSSLLRMFCDRFRICTNLSSNELEIEFWKSVCSMCPEPGIEPVLLRARELGISTGVISNAMFSGEVLRWELARHDLLKHFQIVLSSADYGLQKPHPAIFLAAAGILGIRPAEIWFIGDSLEKDVAGARSAGLTPFWYNPKHNPCDTRSESTIVGSWGEFHETLLHAGP